MANRERMLAPLADEEIRTYDKTWKDRSGNERSITLTYIEDETVMDRLDAGYGPGNWQVQVDALPYAEGVVKVRLGVRESGEWSWFEDFGYPNRDGGETLKEAVSDGIRRCGRYVGIARDLYRKATYEVGGSLGPKGPTPEGPIRTLPSVPPKPTLIGPYTGTGKLVLGRTQTSDGLLRETPEGPALSVKFEDTEGKATQVIVRGRLAADLYDSAPNGEMNGLAATVEGDLWRVPWEKDGKPMRPFLRLELARIVTSAFTLPAGPTDEELAMAPDAEDEAEFDAIAQKLPL